MKLSPQSTAGGSGELFPPCPKYIVQSQWPNGRKVLGYFRKLPTFRPGRSVAVGYMDRENRATELAGMPIEPCTR
jgi:hypothetical protein